MGFLDSIGAAFKPAPAQAPTANAEGNAGNMQFGSKPSGAAAPNADPATLPNAGVNDPNSNPPAKTVDPFDKYKGMFDNKASTDAVPNYVLDPAMLKDAAGAQDFLSGISPELVQKATNGDTAALMQMMNEAGRNAYKAALSHGGRLTESFVGSREGFRDKGFSQKVRGEMTVNALTQTPNFNNPVVRKQLIDIANSLQKQHPDAAPGEIADMARDYITQISNAIATPTTPAKAEAQNSPTDFNEWFADNRN